MITDQCGELYASLFQLSQNMLCTSWNRVFISYDPSCFYLRCVFCFIQPCKYPRESLKQTGHGKVFQFEGGRGQGIFLRQLGIELCRGFFKALHILGDLFDPLVFLQLTDQKRLRILLIRFYFFFG